MTAAITPQALRANAELLRCLNTGEGAHTLKTLAEALGRDLSNLRKTVATLEKQGLLGGLPGGLIILTPAGRTAAVSLPAPAPKANGVRDERFDEPMTWLRHDQLVPHPKNPRREFDPVALDELRQSILLADGLLQNLVVTPKPDDPEHFWILAGHRRWRAIGQAIDEGDWPPHRPLPCQVRADQAPRERLSLALMENIQRTDLTPLEEAQAYHTLASSGARGEPGLTNVEIADMVGRTPRHVQMRRQLLDLPDEAKADLAAGKLNVTQARAKVQTPKALPPLAALALAELADKIARDPDPDGRASTRVNAFESAEARQLVRAGMCGFFVSGTGAEMRDCAVLTSSGREWADAQVRAAKTIAQLIGRLRAAAGKPVNLAEGQYSTPWLNVPLAAAPVIPAKASPSVTTGPVPVAHAENPLRSPPKPADPFMDQIREAAREPEDAAAFADDLQAVAQMTDTVRDILAFNRGRETAAWAHTPDNAALASLTITALRKGDASWAMACLAHLRRRAGAMGYGDEIAKAMVRAGLEPVEP
jgi:ParB/RepB/Spo0J family partition protein